MAGTPLRSPLLPCVGIAILTVAASFATANADSFAVPRDSVEESSDKRYVVVVLVPEPFGRDEAIRKLYPRSGAYRVGRSHVLWTLPYSFRAGKTLVGNDGVHAVLIDSFPAAGATEERQPAVEFFARGRSLRTYAVADLIGGTLAKATRTVSHYLWLNKAEFDPTEKYLDLDTVDGPRRFEVATGALRER